MPRWHLLSYLEVLRFAVLFEDREVFGKLLGQLVAELLVEFGDLVRFLAPTLLVDVEDLFKRLDGVVETFDVDVAFA